MRQLHWWLLSVNDLIYFKAHRRLHIHPGDTPRPRRTPILQPYSQLWTSWVFPSLFIYGCPLRFHWALVWSQQLDCFYSRQMVQPISKRASIPGLATVFLNARSISMAARHRAALYILLCCKHNTFQRNLQAAHVWRDSKRGQRLEQHVSSGLTELVLW